jgi:hypothetical protein
MERCFSMEAKRFSFSAQSEGLDLCMEKRRKGFCRFIFLGLQGSAWLLAIVEEALKVSVKDFVKYFQENVKVSMVRGGENKFGRYLEVIVFAKGGRKGVIWLLEGRKGGSWARVAGELRKMITFLGPKNRLLGSEASTTEGIQIRSVSPSRVGGVSPSYAAVVRGEVVSHIKHAKLRDSDVELCGLDLFPKSCCRVVEDGRLAVNCFNLEEQPQGSTKESTLPTCSRGSPVDPMGKDLNLRLLGKKNIHAFHFARGVTTARLTLNLCAWIWMFVSFNLSMGRAVGKLLGRFARSG